MPYVACEVYRLQEEIKKSKQISDDLAQHQQQLKEKTALSDELQQSLVSLKEELVTALQRFEQTKRHLEDQLIDEERAREEMQEQNLEFRKTNKKLVKELESLHKDSAKLLAVGDHKGETSSNNQHPGGVTPAELKGLMRKKLDDVLCQLEWSQMRENDLLAIVQRLEAARAAVSSKPAPTHRVLSRMPSTTVVTRFVPSAESEMTKSMMIAASGRGGPDGTRSGGKANQKYSLNGNDSGGRSNGEQDGSEDGDDGSEQDAFGDDGFMGGGGSLEVDKSFEAYHQEVHRMLTEIEESRDKNQKQQKVIVVRTRELLMVSGLELG